MIKYFEHALRCFKPSLAKKRNAVVSKEGDRREFLSFFFFFEWISMEEKLHYAE